MKLHTLILFFSFSFGLTTTHGMQKKYANKKCYTSPYFPPSIVNSLLNGEDITPLAIESYYNLLNSHPALLYGPYRAYRITTFLNHLNGLITLAHNIASKKYDECPPCKSKTFIASGEEPLKLDYTQSYNPEFAAYYTALECSLARMGYNEEKHEAYEAFFIAKTNLRRLRELKEITPHIAPSLLKKD